MSTSAQVAHLERIMRAKERGMSAADVRQYRQGVRAILGALLTVPPATRKPLARAIEMLCR